MPSWPWRRAKASAMWLRCSLSVSKPCVITAISISARAWPAWYTKLRQGSPRKLTKTPRQQLAAWSKASPQEAGYTSGCWTTPMMQDLIQRHFGVAYSLSEHARTPSLTRWRCAPPPAGHTQGRYGMPESAYQEGDATCPPTYDRPALAPGGGRYHGHRLVAGPREH